MNEENIFVVCDGVVVAESALLVRERVDKYGSIKDLPDEELADPDELERMVFKQQWGPILALPVKGSKNGFRGSVDEDGRVDFGAFATVDFERYSGEFDKARYKADKLKEKLKDLVIMVQIVNERIPGRTKYKILKYVRMGHLALSDILDEDMHQLAELYLRALKLRKEIGQLQQRSWERRQARLKAWLES